MNWFQGHTNVRKAKTSHRANAAVLCDCARQSSVAPGINLGYQLPLDSGNLTFHSQCVHIRSKLILHNLFVEINLSLCELAWSTKQSALCQSTAHHGNWCIHNTRKLGKTLCMWQKFQGNTSRASPLWMCFNGSGETSAFVWIFVFRVSYMKPNARNSASAESISTLSSCM